MARRIRSWIEATDAIRRACAAQLARIHLLRSQTIHSFCQSLLRQFPIEAGLDPQFKIIEGFERTLLHSQLYDAWIDEETRTKPSQAALHEWEVLLAHAGYLFQIRDMIFTLVDRRDLLDETGYDLGDLSLVADDLRAALFALRRGDHPLHRYIASSNTPARDAELDEWIDYFAPIAQLIRDINLNHFPKSERDALKVLRAGGTKAAPSTTASSRTAPPRHCISWLAASSRSSTARSAPSASSTSTTS